MPKYTVADVGDAVREHGVGEAVLSFARPETLEDPLLQEKRTDAVRALNAIVEYLRSQGEDC